MTERYPTTTDVERLDHLKKLLLSGVGDDVTELHIGVRQARPGTEAYELVLQIGEGKVRGAVGYCSGEDPGFRPGNIHYFHDEIGANETPEGVTNRALVSLRKWYPTDV